MSEEKPATNAESELRPRDGGDRQRFARLRRWWRDYPREMSVAVVGAIWLLLLALCAPGFFVAGNLSDLAVGNAPALMVAIGMTAIIICRQIDISVGAQFAWCTVAAGLLAKSGMPRAGLFLAIPLFGAVLGMLNGWLIAFGGIPSIVATLAISILLRDGLRWIFEGAWIQELPGDFQWLGLGQSSGQWVIVATTLLVWVLATVASGNLAAARAIYATGSNEESARLAGLSPQRITLGVFVFSGALTGVAALLNSVRFSELQSNSGNGLELKTIAAVVIGGTAINGGRGTLVGTLLGVVLLGTIGAALTYLGIHPSWEKAIQGAIVLAAVSIDLLVRRSNGRA